MSGVLGYRNYFNEMVRLKSGIYNTNQDSERIAIFEELFDSVFQYLHNTESNKEIRRTAGVSAEMDSIVSLAKSYASIARDTAFARIFTLANEYFDISYYSTALSLFMIAKEIASPTQAVDCALSLALLYEEAGDILSAHETLTAQIESDELVDDNISLSKLNALYVKISLNNLFTEDTKARSDDDYLSALEKCENRINTASSQDTNNVEAYYIYGQILEKKALHVVQQDIVVKTHKRAIRRFNEAIVRCTAIDDDALLFKANCYIALGKAYEGKKTDEDYNSARDAYQNARNIFDEGALDYPVYLSVVADLIAQLDAKISGDESDQGFSDKIDSIMKSQDMAELEKKYYENKAVRKNFVRERHRLSAAGTPTLHILQRWNSFTPILSNDTSPSKGGGYFVTTGNTGIVFDPGFDFIQNFRNAGFFFNDIDHIFVTHAHNDHTADLESLLALLHDYNEEIQGHRFSEKENSIFRKMMKRYRTEKEAVVTEKVEEAFLYSPRRKKLRIYVSPGTKEKCGFLKLGSKQEYEVVTLNTAQVHFENCAQSPFLTMSGGVKIDYNGQKEIVIYPIPAIHNDLMTDSDCYGYVIQFLPENNILWYTGDTGFNEEVKEKFTAIKNGLNCNGMVLLAHIGGFKPDEQYYYRTNASKAYYKTHLGRLGLCQLIECLEPKVCLVSEFGEEFKDCRKKLIDIFKSVYTDCCIFPVDVGFVLKLGAETEDTATNPKYEILSRKAASEEKEYILIRKGSFREKDDGNELDFYHESSMIPST